MNKKKLGMFISIAVCAVLIVTVLCITFLQPEHKHSLSNARVYHISNSEVYYTRSCKDGYSKKFETNATFAEIMSTATSNDTIVLDEDIVLNDEITLKSFVVKNNLPQGVKLNINLTFFDIFIYSFTFKND